MTMRDNSNECIYDEVHEFNNNDLTHKRCYTCLSKNTQSKKSTNTVATQYMTQMLSIFNQVALPGQRCLDCGTPIPTLWWCFKTNIKTL